MTTFYSLEVPDILGPAIRAPIDDLSSLAENLILLRYIELRSQLYRLISVMKVRTVISIHRSASSPSTPRVWHSRHPCNGGSYPVEPRFQRRAGSCAPGRAPPTERDGD